MSVRKFRPRREITVAQATLVQFIGLSWLDRWRWLLFGWRSLTPHRNQTMRQAFRAEKQKTTTINRTDEYGRQSVIHRTEGA